MERTLVLIKPDGVGRGLTGEVVTRFERAGFRIAGMKMVTPSRAQVELFYPTNDVWFVRVGERSAKTFRESGMSVEEKFGTADAAKIGRMIKDWIVRFMTSGSVVAMVLEGDRAVENARRLVGETIPIKALPGTIRGDFSIDSVILGNSTNRPMVNVVHASESVDEAKREIGVWFKEAELFEYRRETEDIFYRVW